MGPTTRKSNRKQWERKENTSPLGGSSLSSAVALGGVYYFTYNFNFIYFNL